VGKFQGKTVVGTRGSTWENNIKMVLKK